VRPGIMPAENTAGRASSCGGGAVARASSPNLL
jgi:hypothetical protein